MKSVGVVGAGLSALSCSYQLINYRSDVHLTLFEKSKGVGGRAATRRSNEYTFDQGANYLSTDSLGPTQLQQLHNLLEVVDPTRQRVNINNPIYILKGDNTIEQSQRVSEKLTFPQGINQLGKLIHDYNSAKGLNYKLHKTTLISHIEQIRNNDGSIQWRLYSEDQQVLTSDLVLFCPPAPQTHAIIKKSQFLPEYQDHQQRLLKVLSKSEYYQQISVALGFDKPLEDRPFFALVNLDRNNDVAWLSFEHMKPGHIQTGNSMIIMQMSHEWSLKYWQESSEKIATDAYFKAQKILDKTPEQYSFQNVHKWKFALPKTKIERSELQEFSQLGLYFTGDSFADKGRVGVAVVSGLETAKNILQNSKL